MNYASELKKFITSQYILLRNQNCFSRCNPEYYFGVFRFTERIFLISTRNPFPSTYGFYRTFSPKKKRTHSCLDFIFVSLIAGIAERFPTAYFLEIIIFGMFFTMLGVYGQRLAAVGSLTLVF